MRPADQSSYIFANRVSTSALRFSAFFSSAVCRFLAAVSYTHLDVYKRQGLSVPDSALLIELSEAFKVSVSDLLGSAIDPLGEDNVIAQKLEQLNLLLAERNRPFKYEV